jgi:hypothetical protein
MLGCPDHGEGKCDVIRITTQDSHDSVDSMTLPTPDVQTATSVHTRRHLPDGVQLLSTSLTYEVYKYDFKQPLVITSFLDRLSRS